MSGKQVHSFSVLSNPTCRFTAQCRASTSYRIKVNKSDQNHHEQTQESIIWWNSALRFQGNHPVQVPGLIGPITFSRTYVVFAVPAVQLVLQDAEGGRVGQSPQGVGHVCPAAVKLRLGRLVKPAAPSVPGEPTVMSSGHTTPVGSNERAAQRAAASKRIGSRL